MSLYFLFLVVGVHALKHFFFSIRSHRQVDDTPRFTPTHKYNVWEDDRRSTGATPRFSKGKREIPYVVIL